MTGADLRAYRERLGLSRRALARKAGIGETAVRYWESKAVLDLRGWAPRRLLGALGLELLPERGPAPALYLGTIKRARGGVLAFTAPVPKARPVRVPCGARTRRGTPCRANSEPGKRRCRFHGGRSTGPRTPEGKSRIAEAQRRRWARWRAERGDG